MGILFDTFHICWYWTYRILEVLKHCSTSIFPRLSDANMNQAIRKLQKGIHVVFLQLHFRNSCYCPYSTSTVIQYLMMSRSTFSNNAKSIKGDFATSFAHMFTSALLTKHVSHLLKCQKKSTAEKNPVETTYLIKHALLHVRQTQKVQNRTENMFNKIV